MNQLMAPPNTPKRKPLRALAWSAATLFLVAGLAPLVAAQPPEERGERSGHGFLLDLDGTVTLRDNRTYALEIDGRGVSRMVREDGNFTIYKGRAQLKVTILDENGTAVRQGESKAFLRAKCNDEGECRWMLISHWRGARKMAFVNLHGTALADPEGGYDLTGLGHIVLKARQERAHAGKVEVSGDFIPRGA